MYVSEVQKRKEQMGLEVRQEKKNVENKMKLVKGKGGR